MQYNLYVLWFFGEICDKILTYISVLHASFSVHILSILEKNGYVINASNITRICPIRMMDTLHIRCRCLAKTFCHLSVFHRSLGDITVISVRWFSHILQWLIIWAFAVKIPKDLLDAVDIGSCNYLNQCWVSFVKAFCVTYGWWVNPLRAETILGAETRIICDN